MLAATGDAAAPWIAFGTVALCGLLGALIMAWKGRSAGWGFVVGLIAPVLGHAVLLDRPSYPSQRHRLLVALLGAASVGCLVMVIALLAAITTGDGASGQHQSGTTIHADDWKTLSCPDGFDSSEPTPGPHYSNGPCTVETTGGSAYRCSETTVVVDRDGSSTATFSGCEAETTRP